MAPTSSGLTLDGVLTNYLGECGPGQRKLLLYASLLWVPQCCFILLMVFTNKDSIKEKAWACQNQADESCLSVYSSPAPTLKDFCGLSSNQWQWTNKKTSIISDFGLVCGKAIFSQLVNSAFFLGYLIGSGLFGSIADQHGRRKTLMISMLTATAGTVMSGFSPDYWVYLVSRILTGVGAAGQSLVTYLLATESVGPQWRGLAGVATQMFFIVGEFVLVLMAWLIQPWRLLCFAIAAMSAASGLLLFKIPESPRWLLAKGRKAEAVAILEQLSKENGTRMPLEPLADPLPSGTGGVHQKMTLGQVLKDRHICRRFLVLAYVWCILCMTYYGISLALGGLQGSFYLIFAVSAAAEIPSNVLGAWMIERIGRHNSLAAGMLLGGAACLICSFVPAGFGQAVCAAIGKLGCAGAFTIASIYTSELFPTLVRSAVLGLENEAARVGGIAAPFIVLLGTQISSSMPFLVFGVTSVFAGFLIFTLPETLGAPMPDTMRDMEAIQSIFTTQAWKKGWKETRNQLFSTHAPSTQSLDSLAAVKEEEHSHASSAGEDKSKAKSAAVLDAGHLTPHDAISVGHDRHSGGLNRRSGSGSHKVHHDNAETAAHHHHHHHHHHPGDDEQSALLGSTKGTAHK